ncbi:hypothetical protein [Hydrogenophaga sp.]|uniref:hypothetical protein n=1 Tax=Hydrogenophaga sp. TaxID=1904254 RepID=UPI003F6C3F7E
MAAANYIVAKRNVAFQSIAFFLLILLVAMPLADFLTVYARDAGISSIERFSIVYRAVMLLLLIILNSLLIRKSQILLWASFIFSGLSIAINLLLADASMESVGENFLLLIKFYLIFLFYNVFAEIVKNRYLPINRLVKTFTLIIFAYTLSIPIGAIFDISSFQFYANDRWGVKGIIISGNEMSGFLIIALAWALLAKKSIFKIILVLLTALAMMLSGTKAAFLGLVLLLTGYFWANGGIKRLFYAAPTALLFLFICSLLVYMKSERVRLEVENTFAYFNYQFSNQAEGSILTLGLSGRNIKLYNVYNDIFSNRPWTLFTGGYPIADYSIEMDFFDLLILAGPVSFFIYAVFWVKQWRDKNSFNKAAANASRFKLVFLVAFISLSFFGGHMLYSAVAAPFLAMLIIKFQYYNQKVNA